MIPLSTRRAPWPRMFLCMAAFAVSPVLAQTELIQLSSADEERLGIRYDSVQASSTGDGLPVPAHIIDSPDQRSQIKTFFKGTLSRWHIQGGQSVQQGQTVVSIDSPELMVLQEQWLAAHHHQLDTAQQLSKDKQLLADGIIAEQRLLQTQRAHRQAVFSLQARRRQLYQAGLTDQDLDALQSGDRLPGDYRLRAPQAGVISRQHLAVGDVVSAGQSLASVTDTSSLWLRAALPLALAETLQPGDVLKIAHSSVPLTLISKNAALSPTTQRVAILARFEQPVSLYPGQQVSLIIPANRRDYRIPAAAVTHNGDATVVYIKTQNGIEARQLDLIPLGQDYLATDNIAADDKLVVQGSAQLKGIQLGLGGGE